MLTLLLEKEGECMTTEQASERFGVPLDRLRLYEAQGLFDCRRRPDSPLTNKQKEEGNNEQRAGALCPAPP